MSARLQLAKIIGPDNFPKYARFVIGSMHRRFRQRGLMQMGLMQNGTMQKDNLGPVGGLEFMPMTGDFIPVKP
jgi:hypothetical protein